MFDRKKGLLKFTAAALIGISLMMTGCAEEEEPVKDEKGVPNYANTENWMILPEENEYPVDVIYLNPTTYFNAITGMTSAVDNKDMRKSALEAYEGQGSAFEGIGNVYAPYYRCFNGYRMVGKNYEQLRGYIGKEPSDDIFAALNYYFENYNDGRPYILAGNGQGSMILNIVLDEYMELHKDYYDNMIAAYQIGYGLSEDFLAANPHVKVAEGEDDLGVVISWNTENSGNAETDYSAILPEDCISINPLNWKTDDTYAGTEENLGGTKHQKDGSYEQTEGYADAKIDLERGTLICDSIMDDKSFNPENNIFGPGSYHEHEYELYYQNIRENAKLRTEKWLELHQK